MTRVLGIVRSFLDRHPLVRRWIAPLVFMAALLLPLFALRYTAVQAAQLTGVFLGFSAVAVAVGVVLEKVIEYSARRG